MIRKYLTPILVFLFAATLCAEDAPKESPSAVVARVQAALIEAMKSGDKAGFQERFDKLAPVMKSTHAFGSIARVALGKNWKQLTAAQQTAFTDSFTTLGIATYAANFKEHHGEEFKIQGEKPMERGQVYVRSTLTKGDGGEVKFDYVMDAKEGKWMIINIIADGVSDLALKRAEYESVISKEGFDALHKSLLQKIEDLKGAPAK
ncbi:ABC transporter substrate-binding protein [Candidatus Sumerlaeota bacterium]|nr:ABC transporter substrate-binding protein [Candidatus Sumerlaeota bacterium]